VWRLPGPAEKNDFKFKNEPSAFEDPIPVALQNIDLKRSFAPDHGRGRARPGRDGPERVPITTEGKNQHWLRLRPSCRAPFYNSRFLLSLLLLPKEIACEVCVTKGSRPFSSLFFVSLVYYQLRDQQTYHALLHPHFTCLRQLAVPTFFRLVF